MAIRSSGRIAAEQGEARWYDAKCELLKPYVCQAFGVSQPFSLTVSTALNLAGGHIIGAGSVISSVSAKVNDILSSSTLYLHMTIPGINSCTLRFHAQQRLNIIGAKFAAAQTCSITNPIL